MSNNTQTARQAAEPKGAIERIPALDAVRGIAILVVIFHHCTILEGAPGGLLRTFENVSSLGRYGVDLFFVLSGFLITSILLKTKRKPGYFRNFYVRRILRVFPLYYAIVAVCVFILPAIAAHTPAAARQIERLTTGSSAWPWYCTYTTNFLIAVRGTWVHPILGVTWSLDIEEQFYCLWPLLVLMLSRRQLVLASAALTVGGWALRAALAGLVNWIPLYAFTLTHMDGLTMGALIAALDSETMGTLKRYSRVLWAALAAVVGGNILLCGNGLLAFEDALNFKVGFALSVLACAIFVCLALVTDKGSIFSRVLSNRTLSMWGRYSYAMYLIHMPLRACLRDTVFRSPRVTALLGNGFAFQFAFYAVAMAVILVAAYVCWHVIENPALKLKALLAPYREKESMSEQAVRDHAIRVGLEQTTAA